MFFTVVLSGVLLMSLYVGWRAGSVSPIARWVPRWPRAALLVLLGSSYLLARDAERAGWPGVARVLEFSGAHWIGVLLLLFVALLAADLLTCFGFLFRRHLPSIRAWAFVAGAALSAAARFPYLAGRYAIGGTSLIVCRGTGTFGPRMRLWHPAEIVRVTIRGG